MNAKPKKRRWHCLSGQEPTELDKQVMYWEQKGKLVPTRDLIKTPEQIEGIRRAGVVNTGVLDAVAAAIHEGMNTLEIDQICRKYCEEHHAIPACLGYEGFPMSVCTSINEVVCHGIPKETDVLQEGDETTPCVNGITIDSSVATAMSGGSYQYKGVKFNVKAVADAVQTHNGEQAMQSAWGRTNTSE